MINKTARRKLSRGGALSGTPLKPVCIAGLALALLFAWGLVFFGVIWSGEIPARETEASAFARELEQYDLFDAPGRALEGQDPEQTERRLTRLRRKAEGAEELLSVLKRRRVLARIDRRYIPAYEKAALEAAEAFPYSASIAAAAVDALVSGAFSAETGGLLKKYAPRLSQNRFGLLELSAHILAGNLENPETAADLPQLLELLSFDLSALPAGIRQDLLTDEFLLRAVRGDISGASFRLNALLSGETPEAGLGRMGAEFFYDHHNPLRAAELFLQSGEPGIGRAADALVLSGDIPGARNIWLVLASASAEGATPLPSAPPGDIPSYQSRSRSIYNLAAASLDSREETSWLEKFFSLQAQRQGTPDSTGIYSIVRYTRLLDSGRGAAILEENKQFHALLDLELLRRKLDTWPPTRAAAEIWILLGNHSEDEALYEWAAWYFDHQRLYAETAQVLKEASRKGMAGAWLDLYRGLALIREEKNAEGERILKESAGRLTDWRFSANLGRIEESRRAVSAALAYYENAAALVKERKSAAQIQMRISRCLEALGRERESRRALETALEADPENLNIRRELRRFDSR